MIPLVWLKSVGLAGALALAFSLAHTGYTKIKQVGYDEAAAKYELVIKTHLDDTNAKIRSIELSSSILVAQQKASTLTLSKDISSITKGLKGKTLTIIKNGECTPSKEFSDSFVEINKRANQSLKEGRK